MIATPIVLVGLLALLGFGLWWGWNELTRPPSPEPVIPCEIQEMTELTSDQVHVQVLNGGTVTGRARQISDDLARHGFHTDNPANTEEAVEGTVIVGASENDPAVLLVHGFFPESQIRGDDRVDGTVHVLIGDDDPGFFDEALTTIEVPDGQVCLPPASPQPSE